MLVFKGVFNIRTFALRCVMFNFMLWLFGGFLCRFVLNKGRPWRVLGELFESKRFVQIMALFWC